MPTRAPRLAGELTSGEPGAHDADGDRDEQDARHSLRDGYEREDPHEDHRNHHRRGKEDLLPRDLILLFDDGHLHARLDRGARAHGADEIPRHPDEAEEVEGAAHQTGPIERPDGDERLHEARVEQAAAFVLGAPHQPLLDAGGPHGEGVEENAQGADPEVRVRRADAVEWSPIKAGHQEIEHAGGHEPVPSEPARVHVCDDPVGVVRESRDALDGEEGSFEGSHPVRRDPDREELQHRVATDLVPRAPKREEAVEHAAPARRPEHQAEDHPQRLSPVGQRRVEEVMRPRPDVDEDQRPEVDDREPVGEDGAVRSLRHEVVHDAEHGGREEERDCVVPVPPLNQRILNASEDGVALERSHGDREAVHHVQHGDRDDGGDVEPQGDVEVLLVAPLDGQEEVRREHQPDDRDGDVDGPLELRVLLALGESERKRDRRREDDELPAPEVDGAQRVVRALLGEALRRIVDPREDHVADEREDDRVRVQRAQPAEGEVGPDVGFRERELKRDERSYRHPDDGEDDRRPEEAADDLVVIADGQRLHG